MNEEDEAFNEIERQAKQRKEAVRAAMLREEDDDIQDYKKPWVGLTDEDFYGQSDLQRLAMKYAEAKLKEKNT